MKFYVPLGRFKDDVTGARIVVARLSNRSDIDQIAAFRVGRDIVRALDVRQLIRSVSEDRRKVRMAEEADILSEVFEGPGGILGGEYIVPLVRLER